VQHRPLPESLPDSWRASAEALERKTELDAREEGLETREAALAARGEREHELLADADKRDDEANARDAVANRRDMESGLAELIDSPTGTATIRARGVAALDRRQSRQDRAASKTDRSKLTNDGSTPPPE
jgi:hypothetical protein